MSINTDHQLREQMSHDNAVFPITYFHPVEPVVKVGLLAQAPVGDGGIRVYENLSIEKATVKNIRAGK